VDPVLEQEGAVHLMGREEACFIEQTYTEDLYHRSLTAVEVVKITCRGPSQRGCKGRGGTGSL
jgi:hypothetical protein